MCTFVWTVIVFNWVFLHKNVTVQIVKLKFYETKRCCKHVMGDCYSARTHVCLAKFKTILRKNMSIFSYATQILGST